MKLENGQMAGENVAGCVHTHDSSNVFKLVGICPTEDVASFLFICVVVPYLQLV